MNTIRRAVFAAGMLSLMLAGNVHAQQIDDEEAPRPPEGVEEGEQVIPGNEEDPRSVDGTGIESVDGTGINSVDGTGINAAGDPGEETIDEAAPDEG